MDRKLVRLAALFALLALAAVSASAQDFQRSYNLGSGGGISVRNVSGNIVVKGYDGAAVVVTGRKEGSDQNMVEVEDLSSGNSVDVRAKYDRCNGCSIRASINFEVQVPRSLQLAFDKLSTASGDIEVSGVSGSLNVSSASGDVKISNVRGRVSASTASGSVYVRDAAGTVKATSASGDVDVEISSLEGAEDLQFSTASGDVSVKLPASLDAEVSMSTVSGRITTDFPVSVEQSQWGPGQRARGRLGAGQRSLKISTASGDVSLRRM